MVFVSVLIVIPTVDGREDNLDNCLSHYGATLGEKSYRAKWDVCVIRNRDTCGEAWNYGAKIARNEGFEYVHMTADDLIPHPGWYECAVETVETGYIPSALIYSPDGAVESHGTWKDRHEDWTEVPQTLIPFCRTEDWIDIPNIHYYSDNAVSSMLKYQGYTIMAREEYAFTHYMAQPGRKGPARDEERQTWIEWEKTL